MTNHPNDGRWVPCRDGTLSGLSSPHDDVAISRRKMLLGSGAGILLGAGFIVRSLLIDSVPTPTYVLTCRQVVDNLPEYAAGNIKDASMQLSMKIHIEDCGSCLRKFEAIV